MKATIQTQNFVVTGSISFPITTKNKFFNDEIAKLEADLFVAGSNKKHLLIADEGIEISWDGATGTLSMPIMLHTRVDNKEQAIAHAYTVLNNTLNKIKVKVELTDATEKKFTAKDGIHVEWNQAN